MSSTPGAVFAARGFNPGDVLGNLSFGRNNNIDKGKGCRRHHPSKTAAQAVQIQEMPQPYRRNFQRIKNILKRGVEIIDVPKLRMANAKRVEHRADERVA